VAVSDLTGASGSVTFTWSINALARPSTITVGYQPNVNSYVGIPLTLKIQASDSQGLAISFRVVNLPPGLKLNASTGVITGTPTQNGLLPTRVYVTDGSGASAVVAFQWAIAYR
jgi:Putative Ig domain